MTDLTPKELLQLYESVIKPFGHPDPLGYLTRALLESDGNPDYVDVEGKRGFMPVLPEVALEMTGATEVQSLQGNVVATLTMDRMLFDKYRTVDSMMIAFQYGEDSLGDTPTKHQKEFINEVNESRGYTQQLVYPPLATVSDVIDALDERDVDKRLTGKEKSFFSYLLKG